MCDSCDWQHVLPFLLFSLMLLRGITVSRTRVRHSVFNAFSLEVFLPHQDRIQQLKQAGKPLIWVIVWVIVGVVMTQKEGLCLCARVSKREKVKANKCKGEWEREKERPHLCSPWDGIFMDGWAWWGLETHKESFSVCCRQLTVCACLLNFQ